MAERCRNISDLIDEYGFDGQAHMLRGIRRLSDQDTAGFIVALSDGRVWGSSGSVLDIWLPAGDVPEGRDVGADQRFLRRELLALAEGLKCCGDPNRITRPIIKFLKAPVPDL